MLGSLFGVATGANSFATRVLAYIIFAVVFATVGGVATYEFLTPRHQAEKLKLVGEHVKEMESQREALQKLKEEHLQEYNKWRAQIDQMKVTSDRRIQDLEARSDELAKRNEAFRRKSEAQMLEITAYYKRLLAERGETPGRLSTSAVETINKGLGDTRRGSQAVN